MNKIKISALSERSLVSVQFSLLMALAIVVPLFHSQYVTGPIVNAALFLAAILTGSAAALFIAMVPSVVAMSTGLLPAVLAPAIPFIMLSNAILVAVFYALRKKSYWLAAISAGLAKFIFLFGSSQLVVGLIPQKQAAMAAASMLSYPQLITAMIGAALAWGVLKGAKKI